MHASAKLFLLAAFVAAPNALLAQGSPDWLVDTLYGSGKINTVIAVVAVILLGLAFWLFRLDRRIARMENHHRQ
jgi:type IV secretory pathway VirB2 component (pilin)